MDRGATAGYLEDFRARGEAIAEACTRCGACFRACPMVAPAGLGEADPAATAAGIVDLITGGAGTAEAARWASVCSGSGNCIPACPEGINTRFMVQLARGFARAQAGDKPLNTRWRQGFQTMSRGVRILSRLQLPPETLARVRGQSEAAAPEPARCRLLYRMQHPEDAAHRAFMPRRARSARRRLRGHGRARAMLRRLPVPRRRFREYRAGRLHDDRRARLGRDLDRAVVVPELPGADRRGGVAEL